MMGIKDRRHFVQRSAFRGVVHIEGQGLEHIADQRGPHDGGVLAQRISNGHGLHPQVAFRQTQLGDLLPAGEGIVHDLQIAHALQEPAQLVLQMLHGADAALRGAALEGRRADVVVAVHPQAFLTDVRFAVQILPERGHLHGEGIAVAGGLEAQLVEDAHHIVGGDFHARPILDALHAGSDHLLRLGFGIEVDHAADHVARVQHVHQMAGAIQRVHHGGGANAALETAAGLGAHPQRAAGEADGRAVEGGAFEHHVGGAFDDLAFLAAHDARQTGGVVRVTDAQIIRPQLPLHAVQRGQRLALAGPADDDLPARYLAQVKGVHGMAVLDHDKVGNIHDIVDGTQTRRVQVLAQPQGRGRDAHVLDDPGRVAGAQVGRFHADFHFVVNVAARFGHVGLGRFERGVQRRGSLPGNAQRAQTVGAVGQNFEIHGVVVNAQNGAYVAAHGVFFVEDQQARIAHAGVQLLRHLQFRSGAEHSLGDHAPQLALLDLHTAGQVRAVQRHGHQHAHLHIGRAAHDVQGFLAAHIHGALVQMGALHVLAGQHTAHDHLVHAVGHVLHALHGRAGHDHFAFIVLGTDGNVRVFPNHIHTQFHRSFPP